MKKTRQKPEGVAKSKLLNRTGIMASPLDSTAQAKASLAVAVTEPDGQNFVLVRGEYEGTALPVGTVPPPLTVKGIGKAVKSMVKGVSASALIDKVGERLAFERSGVRLYEGLVGKLDNRGTFEGGPTRDELLHFQQEELQHFQVLCSAMSMLGGDPTAMTPSADIASVASVGLVQVIADPRTTLPQALQAILIAELADNDSWELLIEVTTAAGQEELAAHFRVAKAQEDEHLAAVRDWMTAYGSLIVRGGDVEQLESN
jgi:hypothetical protein